MLHLLLTRTQIIAGAETGEDVHLLHFSDKPFLEIQGKSPIKSLDLYLPELVSSYRNTMGDSYVDPIPVAYATPVDMSSADRAKIRNQLNNLAQPASFDIIHEDNIGTSFLRGKLFQDGQEDKPSIILDSFGSFTNVCVYKPGKKLEGEELLKVGDPFMGESFDIYPIKGFGKSAGKEKLLSEVLKSFSDAGLKIDVKGQTDLALQLDNAHSPYVFQINQETSRVTIAGEVRLNGSEYQELITHKQDRLLAHLNDRNLKQHSIEHILLLGSFLHHPRNLEYMKSDLNLGDRLMEGGMEDDEHTFEQMVIGLSLRAARVNELTQLRKEEEERRARLEAELKAKEGRESLLERLQRTCIDPAKKEEYEAEFISAGAELGIPDVVISWNISEALNRVSLEQEASKAGLKKAEEEKKEAQQKTAEKKEKPQTKPPQTKTDPVKEEKAPVKKPEVESQPKEKEVTPEPVLAHAEPQPAGSQPVVAQVVAEKVAETGLQVAEAPNKKGPSLSAIFNLENAIVGEEFPSRKAQFKGDSVVKLVRLLPTDQPEDPEAFQRFEKLHQKELAYYGTQGEISEISEAKEGKYYFRDFLDRSTLKEFIQKSGLDRKQKVEDLSSEDLKFILLVFKTVQELEVSHNQLNEDNILVVNKKRGLFSRNGGQSDIRFIGFTSEDASVEKMTEDTHAAFNRILGDKFYSEFRKQFQL